MAIFAIRYIYQVWKREISPALSTWIIFLLGTGLSLATYAIEEDHDFLSGILNTMDIIVVVAVLAAIIIWGNRKMRFKPFEKWYLWGVGAIVAYGMLSGDAWTSNILTQILISVGYFPTIQNLLTEKKNTESFTGWILVAVAGFIALYPATVNGNVLATLYATRTVVLVAAIIAIMAYYSMRDRAKKA